MRIILMGVAGSGKTTIGSSLAPLLKCTFKDADDYHSQENRDKMSRGEPLTDADRLPWLQTLAQMLSEEDNVILACSALKIAYREILSAKVGPGAILFILLDVPKERLLERLRSRASHYFPPELLESQLASLELPSNESNEFVSIQSSDDIAVTLARAMAAVENFSQRSC